MKINGVLPVTDQVIMCILALAAPHLLYVIVWTQTAAFIRFARRLQTQAFDLFCSLSVFLKFFQLGALVSFAVTALSPYELHSTSPLQLTLGLTALAVGQILNIGVYRALGKEGVYYGVKLGKPIDWYNGFPFNVVKHPQYVGCVLCIWGVTALVWTSENVAAGLLTVAVSWTVLYALTGVIEGCF